MNGMPTPHFQGVYLTATGAFYPAIQSATIRSTP